ncbi:MAG TPA: nuclear transport factor 2 family protein [Gaiellaceae bacterium]|nr:nuclear transport factor 2 family protein [Gaiellaceae bacterium]
MGADPEQSVRRLAEAINRRDADAAVEVCHPEIEFLSVLAVSGRAFLGHDGIREYFEDISSAWDEWRVEVHRVAPAADGRVVIVMTMHMRGKESGAPLSQRTGHVWTLKDGKLLRNQPFRNPDDALREVGIS